VVIYLARPREPIELLKAKGKKHLTKAEIAQRELSEVKAEADNIIAPEYLSKKQRKEFDKISGELERIGIISNLDCDALSRYIIAKDNYIKFSKIVDDLPVDWEMLGIIDKATAVQDRVFKQCQSAARELGLTISSRCKLVIPPTPEKEELSGIAAFRKKRAGE
jgi:P27 family predicted phage terminase small subunit